MEIYNDIQLINCSNNLQLKSNLNNDVFLYKKVYNEIELINDNVYQICPLTLKKDELIDTKSVSIEETINFLSIKGSEVKSKLDDIKNILNASQLIITANILIQYYGVNPADVYSLLAIGNKLLFINNKFLIMKK